MAKTDSKHVRSGERAVHRAGVMWFAFAVATLCSVGFAKASVMATISVGGSAQAGDSSSIVVAFNGFMESVRYDSTSTANSVASAFAAKFSSDYLAAGLCASAKGGLITLQIKRGTFGTVSISDTNASFALTPTGFGVTQMPPVANAGGPYYGTAGTAVAFSGAGSTDPQGQALTYVWAFGDGGTATGVTPSHTYGVAGTYTVSLTVTDAGGLAANATAQVTMAAAPPLADVAITGTVYGGQHTVSGAHVYLFAANTTGYGRSSVPLLVAANTGYVDAVGPYVLSAADGTFRLTGDYSCTGGQQMYVYALGGDAGFGSNPYAGLVAAIGSCPATAAAITVNEVTTVAAAYALAGFMTDATHLSGAGTAGALVGMANAFATANNIVSTASGTALTTAASGNGSVPRTKINSLAEVLSTCVETNGSGSGCSGLFALVTPSGGTMPVDTVQAILDVAHAPANHAAALYGLVSPSGPFQPIVTFQPIEWTLAVAYNIARPTNLIFSQAIDAAGNVWSTSGGGTNPVVTEISNTGVVLSGTSGYAVSGGAFLLSIDPDGNAWVSGQYGVVKLSPSGSVLLNFRGFYSASTYGIAADGAGNVWFGYSGQASLYEVANNGTNLSGSYGYSFPANTSTNGIVIDGAENAWIETTGNTLKYNSAGTLLSGASGFPVGGALAIDSAGNVWGLGRTTVQEMSSAGTVLSGAGFPICDPTQTGIYVCTGIFNGQQEPLSIAIDGLGNVFAPVTYYNGHGYMNGIAEVNSSGTIVSGGLGYGDGSSGGNYPGLLQVDSSGNLWGGGPITTLELIGVAAPTVTPLSLAARDNQLGTRP